VSGRLRTIIQRNGDQLSGLFCSTTKRQRHFPVISQAKGSAVDRTRPKHDRYRCSHAINRTGTAAEYRQKIGFWSAFARRTAPQSLSDGAAESKATTHVGLQSLCGCSGLPVLRMLMRDGDSQRVYRLHDFPNAGSPGPEWPAAWSARSIAPVDCSWSSSRFAKTLGTGSLPMLLLVLTAREGRLCD
jgi:hypothetical protein